MTDSIRKAQQEDIEAIVDLAEQRRIQYQEYQPTFWRKAENSRELHMPFLHQLLGSEQTLALVHEQDGRIDGFLIATLVPTPPVYDPGGMTCSIDDYWIDDSKDWETIGKALLDAAMQEMKQRGAVQTVVVCAHLDQPKRQMLTQVGFSIASEWYVKNN